MKDKVLVAMSGGVDSSVALIKIIEMGYDAIGVTMKLWEYKNMGGNTLEDSNCCSIGAINNAKLICDKMDVPHYTLDFTDIFREKVVDNFRDEYLAGRTPNPCVRCNSFVKWDAFIEQANKLGAKFIATGHYANIENIDGASLLKKGLDPLKDQAYVLWGIPPETLNRTLFPLGKLTKSSVREIAREYKLETAEIPDSMEICFVADNNYKRFLKDYSPNRISQIGEGEIVDNSGKVMGKHSGYTDYTIGQRKGIGISNPEPLYVSNIDANSNKITVGTKNNLIKNECTITKPNWLVKKLTFPMNVDAQIRYNSPVVDAKINIEDNCITVHFQSPQMAITPGQSIVFYNNDIVLGGGIIETTN
tara:strand:- start:88 stop:1173 length:1086 start_codon:yes stop_codon:yes gene_type:complete